MFKIITTKKYKELVDEFENNKIIFENRKILIKKLNKEIEELFNQKSILISELSKERFIHSAQKLKDNMEIKNTIFVEILKDIFNKKI